MNKPLNILKYIIILFILTFLATEISAALIWETEYKKIFKIKNEQYRQATGNTDDYYKETPLYMKLRTYEEVMEDYWFYKTAGEQYNDKKPILIMGCSFAEGTEIPEGKRVHDKLSQYTHRTVYTLPFGGGGIQNAYYYLTHKKYIDKITKQPEYIIYIFINDQVQRIYRYQFWNPLITVENLRYKLNGEIPERIHPIFKPLWSLYTVKVIQNLILQYKIKNTKKAYSDFVKYVIANKKEADKLWPGVKYIFLEYEYAPDDSYHYINYGNKSELKKEGITVISTYELVKHKFEAREYRALDNYHPSEKAWDETVPALTKKFDL